MTACARCGSALRPWRSTDKALGRVRGTATQCRICVRTVRGYWLAADPTLATIGRTDADWVVIDRIIAGQRHRANAIERAEVVRRLTKAGLSTMQIADRLGCAPRTVTRHRSSQRKATVNV